jgi:hypothetical protein
MVRATSAYDTTKSGTTIVTICGITGFNLDGYEGTIVGTNITIDYPYDDSSQITSLAPVISANAAVSPPSGTAQNFTSPPVYTVTTADGFQAAYTAIVKNSNAKITGFSFANPPATGIIDGTAKTIDVAVPYNTNTAAMIPAISVSPKAAVSPASGTAYNFTNPASYKVIAENGDIAVYTIRVTRAGQGEVTLIYPEDPATGAFPDTIVLSKSGAGGKLIEQNLTVNGDYDSCRWRVDGTVKENGKTIILNAANYTTGIHRISVEVTRNGAVYSKSGSFKIEN